MNTQRQYRKGERSLALEGCVISGHRSGGNRHERRADEARKRERIERLGTWKGIRQNTEVWDKDTGGKSRERLLVNKYYRQYGQARPPRKPAPRLYTPEGMKILDVLDTNWGR